jgi:hypothetical protein
MPMLRIKFQYLRNNFQVYDHLLTFQNFFREQKDIHHVQVGEAAMRRTNTERTFIFPRKNMFLLLILAVGIFFKDICASRL